MVYYARVIKRAGDELSQAQVKLEAMDEVVVEVRS